MTGPRCPPPGPAFLFWLHSQAGSSLVIERWPPWTLMEREFLLHYIPHGSRLYRDKIDISHGVSLRCSTWWFGTCIYCEIIIILRLVTPSEVSFLIVLWKTWAWTLTVSAWVRSTPEPIIGSAWVRPILDTGSAWVRPTSDPVIGSAWVSSPSSLGSALG